GPGQDAAAQALGRRPAGVVPHPVLERAVLAAAEDVDAVPGPRGRRGPGSHRATDGGPDRDGARGEGGELARISLVVVLVDVCPADAGNPAAARPLPEGPRAPARGQRRRRLSGGRDPERL